MDSQNVARASCLIVITGKAPSSTFPFALRQDHGYVTVSISGFAVADRILVCPGSVFAKFDYGYKVVAFFRHLPNPIYCEVAAIDSIPDLEQCVQSLTAGMSPDWKIGWNDTPQSYSLLAILKIPNATDNPPSVTSAAEVAPGESVHVISSPFGVLCRRAFQNSIVQGCVSNIINESMMLVDTRCLPGSEGGAVVNSHGDIVGMIALFLYRSHDNVAISIAFRMSALLRLLHEVNYCCRLSRTVQPSPYRLAERYLACIRVGDSWCTGVIIHPEGYIVTNAHVFIPYIDSGKIESMIYVQIRNCNYLESRSEQDDVAPASLIYLSKGPWDVALLKVEAKRRLGNVTSNPGLFPAIAGMDVLVIGYCVFNPDCLGKFMAPSATRGVISKIVRIDGRPIMIQTSATVNSGNSGGALIDSRTGVFLGIVTSNSKQQVSEGVNVIIPTLNFSIPEWIVSKLVGYIECRDEGTLQQLDEVDEGVYRIWSLSSRDSILCKL